MRKTIDVWIHGGVVQRGRHTLRAGATIRDALEAAGGLSSIDAGFHPTGLVTLNRPFGWDDLPERQVIEWHLDEDDDAWRFFRLEEGDGLVFQVTDEQDAAVVPAEGHRPDR